MSVTDEGSVPSTPRDGRERLGEVLPLLLNARRAAAETLSGAAAAAGKRGRRAGRRAAGKGSTRELFP